MEKTHNPHTSVILSKTGNGYEKIVFKLSMKSVICFICCVLFSGTTIFSSMSPLGLAFYTAVFCRESWFLNYIISGASILLSDTNAPWVYVASLSLVTAVLGIIEFKPNKFTLSCVASLSFFVLKLFYLAVTDFIMYDFFALIIEAMLIFALVFVFYKGFPIVTSIGKRNFISASETICAMGFIALFSLTLTGLPSFGGFNISNIMCILMIYIFSLGGINGGAVVLGVLLGAVGSLHHGTFASVTASFAFGALLASAFSSYGRIGIVLGFVIANTMSALILSDAGSVVVAVYDSIAAAIIFAFLPRKLTLYFSELFSKSLSFQNKDVSSAKRMQENIRKRLSEMSYSFSELSDVYASCAPARELGKEYIMSKFISVTNSACNGCPSGKMCFKTHESKGYYHMSKMLETAFKNDRLSVMNMPEEFRKTCRRCDSFAEKFNAMYNVIKTEKLWLSKLNDSRRLVSDQLSAVADTLRAEVERCAYFVDTKLEENLWAEFDKSGLYPSKITAETDKGGNFVIEISYHEKRTDTGTLDKTAELISTHICSEINSSSPRRHGEEVVYTFYPALSYSASAGYATMTKNGEKQSGDSFKLINNDGRVLTAIISDGMGSGKKAASESETTIELMEKFLMAGFDSDTSLRLINSSLLLKSSRDTFSTIDLCSVNLADATVIFTKLGAANSYIKSKDKIVSVNGSGLPAGILKEIEVEKHHLSIDSDTMIILMSDGVADIALKDNKFDGWIEKELKTINTSNPQIVASKLMETALKLQEGLVHDDMTVIAISIKKV